MTVLAHVTSPDPNLALILKVLPALVVILIVAAICGRLAQMVMQPRVLGEMVAGVLLGPTFFGWLFPDAPSRGSSPRCCSASARASSCTTCSRCRTSAPSSSPCSSAGRCR
ncbi:hypothetical protein ACIHFD_36675 [Nonomuraea sp. NPDC051941]|uniref:hypothetical protein n=1 Tax=Nonomuraea sp. NPDC051941 TaxID=3364373 RepID=UPI0037CC15A7